MSLLRSELYKVRYILCVVLLEYQLESGRVGGFGKFTNLKCVTYDKSFADFRYCRLTVPARNTIALNVYVELYRVPVGNISINVSLFKKANSYLPFLYNVTGDFCKLMAKRSRLSFLRIFLDAFKEVSNINHSCPYNHDIIVKNMIFRDEFLRLVPLPAGDYMFNLKVGAYNDWKANVIAQICVT